MCNVFNAMKTIKIILVIFSLFALYSCHMSAFERYYCYAACTIHGNVKDINSEILQNVKVQIINSRARDYHLIFPQIVDSTIADRKGNFQFTINKMCQINPDYLDKLESFYSDTMTIKFKKNGFKSDSLKEVIKVSLFLTKDKMNKGIIADNNLGTFQMQLSNK